MGNFFKSFGKGILYILVLPVLLVGLACYGVVSIFMFIYLAIKSLVLFFTGRSLYEDLPEDIEAKRRLASVTPNYDIGKSEVSINTNVSSIVGNAEPNYGGEKHDEKDPFYCPEYLKKPDNEEISTNSETETNEPESISLNRENPVQNNPENPKAEKSVEDTFAAPQFNDEILPAQPKKPNNYEDEIMDDDEIEREDNGVDITYGEDK